MSGSFIVSPKHSHRHTLPPDWHAILKRTPGVEIVGGEQSNYLHISATPEAVAHLYATLGDRFHIEPAIQHYPSTPS